MSSYEDPPDLTHHLDDVDAHTVEHDGSTIPADPGDLASPAIQTPSTATAWPPDSGRYVDDDQLGEGGMAEVRLCRDGIIGREVAMKVMASEYTDRPDLQARFVREGLVQAQLDHPAIVPVYEVGRTQDAGRPFFTMKRVRGRTLADIVEGLRNGDPDILERYTRRRLLVAFLQVCMAMDFAHRHGVVHRDLKPANIMLGDFGEVYVLDWGIARVRGAADEPLQMHQVGGKGTAQNAVLGTPGYMAPEQVGDAHAVDGRADVYALGAILFEMLTLQPLHPQHGADERIQSTLAGADARCHKRSPEQGVPPELEHVCVEATTLRAGNRLSSARALNDAIERYLDGNRDLERRRDMANQHAQAASEAARAARQETDDRSVEAHRRAMRELGQALALDPGHGAAREMMVQLLMEPPGGMPGEVEEEMERDASRHTAFALRTTSLGRTSWILYVPLLLWMGIRNVALAAVMLAVPSVASALNNFLARYDDLPRSARYGAAVITMLTLFPLTFLFGPYVALPLGVVASLPSAVIHLDRRGRTITVIAACFTVILPAVLEWSGVVPPAYAFDGGVMQLLPRMVEYPPLPTRVFLLVLSLGAIITSVALLGRVRDALTAAEAKLHRQAWQLRQLMPDDVAGPR